MPQVSPSTFDELIAAYLPPKYYKEAERLREVYRTQGWDAAKQILDKTNQDAPFQALQTITHNLANAFDELNQIVQREIAKEQGQGERADVIEKPKPSLEGKRQQAMGSEYKQAPFLQKMDIGALDINAFRTRRDNAYNAAAREFTPQAAKEFAAAEAEYRLACKLKMGMGGPRPGQKPEERPVYQPPKLRPAGM